MDQKGNESEKNYSAFSLGFNLAAGMAIFSYGGYLIDKKTGGDNWILVGMFLGLLYGAYEIWKLVKNNDR